MEATINNKTLKMLDKKKFKILSNLARASGMVKGISSGIRTIEDFNLEGLLSGLQEIGELINKTLETIQNDN